ncbi:MAG: UDP-N-acetylenolpyruvoylglucosamine reductase, partial [Bacteroidetes bacterium RIFCSPLOWO2_12_FULL_31_6]
VKVGSGEVWHNFVLHCVNKNWGGVENLSFIPGTVGASPIQNIGAYGAELKDVFYEAEILHLDSFTRKTISKEECKFGYRDSIFKQEYKGKIIILYVTFKLNKNPIVNTSYGDINKELEIQNINNPTIIDVSNVVCKIRSNKLPNPNELGNAGSFFKNPVISESQFEKLKEKFPTIVGYKNGNKLIKLAAGWLIEQCGWKGKRIGDAGVHKNQALVLVNYGNAKGSEIIELAYKIQDSVKDKFSVKLEPEINIL